MNKSDNTLLIWVLSWAGVLLALLYSPLGSPDLYHHKNYFSDNQGVNFNKITIANAPKNGFGEESANQEFEIPLTIDRSKKNFNYSINTTAKSILNNSKGNGIGIRRSEVTRNNPNNSASLGGGNFAGNGTATTKLNIQRSSTNSLSQATSFTSSKVDLSLFGDSTAIAMASETVRQNAGGINPGDGTDLSGTPIPVGDGWIALLVMALSYCGFKMNLFQKLKRKIA